MDKKPQKFSVYIPVKPYVKKFLELNYGHPIDLIKFPETHKFFRNLLKNPNHLYEYKYPDNIKNYDAKVQILISEFDFYHYGWKLTKTDIVKFGKEFEIQAKTLMRIIVGVNHSMDMPIAKCIRRFQNTFGFTEDIWPYESIKKDYYRKGHTVKLGFENEIFSKIHKIVLMNLYDSGTLSSKFLKKYVTD